MAAKKFPTVDDKTIELVKLLAQLRADLDIQRVIGLNVESFRGTEISQGLLGHIQRSAVASAAICIRKIYEFSPRHQLNSIPGIIESLDALDIEESQEARYREFGSKYGNSSIPVEAKSYLTGTLGLFTGLNSNPLDRLRVFRNKVGAHSDAKTKIDSLPSDAEFETLYGFANDFYRLVCIALVGVRPASIDRHVGQGLMKLAGSLGVESPKFDFEEEV